MLGHEVESVAQMQTRNRPARALEFAILPAGEDEGGAVQAFLDAAGDDADDALVPALVIERQAGAFAGVDAIENGGGLLLHAGFDFTPLAVDAIQFLGDV